MLVLKKKSWQSLSFMTDTLSGLNFLWPVRVVFTLWARFHQSSLTVGTGLSTDTSPKDKIVRLQRLITLKLHLISSEFEGRGIEVMLSLLYEVKISVYDLKYTKYDTSVP